MNMLQADAMNRALDLAMVAVRKRKPIEIVSIGDKFMSYPKLFFRALNQRIIDDLDSILKLP